jgi:hypothetical protein
MRGDGPTPGRARVLRLAERLDVPLRDRDALLPAAGHAPAYRGTPLDGDHLAMARSALRTMPAGHEPYPAVVIDRVRGGLDRNRAMSLLLDLVPRRAMGSRGPAAER